MFQYFTLLPKSSKDRSEASMWEGRMGGSRGFSGQCFWFLPQQRSSVRLREGAGTALGLDSPAGA